MEKSNLKNVIKGIKSVEDAKNEKRKELKELYDNLTKNDEFLDIIMLQIGKDIEEKFPEVKFRILARIKSPESFDAKRENDLLGLTDKKEIEKVNIYDIIALSIIIEEVPDTVKANDEKFDTHMKELIGLRNETKIIIEKYENEIKEYENRIREDEESFRVHNEQLKTNEQMIEDVERQLIQNTDNEELLRTIEYLKSTEKYIKKNISDFEKRIANIKKDITEKEKTTIKRTKERYSRENNDCNQALADYIVTNMEKFDNMKALNINPIPKRLKHKENYDGYKATHNCFEAEVMLDDEQKLRYPFEVQGKSIDAYYIADRGKAAKYHINPTAQPGKIVKQKKLPDILGIKTEEQKEQFIREFDKKVPRFRIYVPSVISKEEKENLIEKGENAYRGKVYKLGKRESFMIYYWNQLVGNEEIGIEKHIEEFKKISQEDILPDDGGEYSL